jgi:leader peptidase (prepilin peptidase)/N-methyltransferase
MPPLPDLTIYVLVFVVGAVVGSFLNVLALRTLEGRSVIWPPSSCPACGKRIAFQDNIPILSFFLLRGKCRACQAVISWQYPLVELVTAILAVVLFFRFGLSWEFAGMCILGSCLIAVTVTDLREKLIPHDITYPTIVLGLIYSAFVRNDLMGALAGIGASYLIFDFLAHYGLVIYQKLKPESVGEDIDVMGGGDAVLSAVIAAWLGWQRLVLALAVGFLIGTIIGMILLVREVMQAGLLADALKKAVIGAAGGAVLMAVTALVINLATGPLNVNISWLVFSGLGAVCGGLLGFVLVGTQVSKPFPFGPALALGALVAIFIDPVATFLSGGA